MKTYLILHKCTGFSINWENLRASSDYALILLTTQTIVQKLNEEQLSCFNQVIITNEFDVDSLKEKIKSLKVFKNGDLYRIVTNDEYAMGLVAKLREYFGLPGADFKSVKPFTSKIYMKQSLSGSKLAVPKFVRFDPAQYKREGNSYVSKLIDYLGLPIFVKPTCDAASYGTEKLMNAHCVTTWCDNHYATNEYEFEFDEFITGKLYHCDCLVKDNEIIGEYIGEYAFPCYDFCLGKPVASLGLTEDMPDYRRISKFNRELFSAYGNIPDGAFHLEVFKKADGELVFLEIACRAPGGSVPKAHEVQYNANIEENHFRLQMGLPIVEDTKTGLYSAWLWYPVKPGILKETHAPDINSAYEIIWKIKKGDRLKRPTSLRDIACSVVLWNDNPKLLKKDFEHLSLHQPFTLVNEE
ncbi:ATP-grasp domain-containing protein [Cysteiniphilum halobium]|uniref:ATP-grasp domain-containing protein n=1 Tax=Cysteiniphilum halobium TaxID=2219059 RepID=UPI003F854396